MIDVEEHVSAVRRTVGNRTFEAGEARTVTIGRVYDTDVADLWDACTTAERIARWFLPVSGELRLHGRYQLEGNAGGTIESCDPPNGFSATWEFGDQVSWIEVHFTDEGPGRARLQIEHIAPVDDHWTEFGPGAVGLGWELGLLGLTLHVRDGDVDQAAVMAWVASDDGHRFLAKSADAWCAADVAGGEEPDVARAAADRTLAAYTGSGS
jgi:uncharacterized protein YndB with AHSA1/START domain